MIRTATISPCGRYRYDLTRRWDDEPRLGESERSGTMLFVMVNPSTADANQDDATIRRCIGFAKRGGFAGLAVVNLFAYRATDPKELAVTFDPIGPDNHETLCRWCDMADCIVAAWGANPAVTDRRVEDVDKIVRFRYEWWCLGTTKSGAPRHPLYVASSQPLIPWP